MPQFCQQNSVFNNNRFLTVSVKVSCYKIPEFYEETIEIIDRELPGTVQDPLHITDAHW